jgi:hypothetical protein
MEINQQPICKETLYLWRSTNNPFAKKLCSYGDQPTTHFAKKLCAYGDPATTHLQKKYCTIVGDTAAVPQLAEEDAALVVDGLDNGLPSLRLLLGPDSGRVGQALVSDGNTCGFRDDQTSRCCTL